MSELQLHIPLDSLSCGIMEVSEDRKVLYCNAYVERIVGEGELVGRQLETLFSPASQIFLDSYVFPLVLADRSASEIQLTMKCHENSRMAIVTNIDVRADGTFIWSLMACENRDTLYNELIRTRDALSAKTETLSAMTREIAQERDALDQEVQSRTRELRARAEALEQSNFKLKQAHEDQSAFTYALSHDLKAPINTMDMLLQALAQDFGGELAPEARQLVELAADTNQRMDNLINDVVDYSVMVGHGFRAEPIELDQLLFEIVTDMQSDINRVGADVKVHRLPVVQGNAFQLRILFANLLSNALKYCDFTKETQVCVSSRRSARSGRVDVLVSDNGIGIPHDKQDQIFGLFQRLHTFDKIEGSGLGLTLCKRVADNHGSVIDVTSNPGEGACFSVALELAADVTL